MLLSMGSQSVGHDWVTELNLTELSLITFWQQGLKGSLESRTVVLEKTLESPMDNKEIKPVNPKGNQP